MAGLQTTTAPACQKDGTQSAFLPSLPTVSSLYSPPQGLNYFAMDFSPYTVPIMSVSTSGEQCRTNLSTVQPEEHNVGLVKAKMCGDVNVKYFR